jgi:cytochrome P450 family 2 subfamily D
MPYTNAAIHEVQRYKDIIPIPLPHRTSSDVEMQDFLITKVGLKPSKFSLVLPAS